MLPHYTMTYGKLYWIQTTTLQHKNQINQECPILYAYVSNVKSNISICTGAEISGITLEYIERNSKNFENTAVIPTNKQKIQTADEFTKKKRANNQMCFTLKQND